MTGHQIREAYEYLGVSRSTLHALTRSGVLRVTRIGSAPRYRREDLDEYLRRCARRGPRAVEV